jgi:hypothetical protein
MSGATTKIRNKSIGQIRKWEEIRAYFTLNFPPPPSASGLESFPSPSSF